MSPVPGAAPKAAAKPAETKSSRPEFQWDDALLLDDQLSEDERMVRNTARQYAQEKLMSRVLEANRHERFDREIMNELGELGLLGATIHGYGCAAVNYVSYRLLARELERVDSGYRSAMSVQSSLVMHPIHAYGTEAQRQKFLPKLARGEWVGCFGLTEPDAGSDPASMRTRATKTDSGWTIAGNKMWISMGSVAELALIFAQTDPEKKHRGLACFLVPTATDGYGAQEIHGKLGLRSSDTAEISLDDVRVPG